MYNKLRKEIDNIWIVDDHSHPGNEEACKERNIPCFSDLFLSPSQTASMNAGKGFDYQRELHEEAYRIFYKFDVDTLEDDRFRGELEKEYNNRKSDLNTLIQEVLHESKIEHIIASCYLPKSLQCKDNISLVPYVDPLIFPFCNKHAEMKLYLKKEYGLNDSLSFEEYMIYLDAVLDDYSVKNNIGYKFLIAYERSLFFDSKYKDNGAIYYEKAKSGDQEAYVKLQDYLVWYIIKKAVKKDIPVQFHTALVDGRIDDFNVLNMQNFLVDEETQNLKLVLLHASYPNYMNAATLALATNNWVVNNVHIELSGRMMFSNHPKILAKIIRNYLDFPLLWKKIIYGSDMLYGERNYYTCAKTGRDAVYYALSSMLDESIINEDTAIEIAKDILRNNSIRLYNLDLEIH